MSEQMNYLALLERSYVQQEKWAREVVKDDNFTRLEFVSKDIFDFTTYDGGIDIFLAKKAIEVCAAINARKTFDYISNEDNYTWYITMCNMPFFKNRLSWGTSIRGAWWPAYEDKFPPLKSCGLWTEGDDPEQILELKLDDKQWPQFIAALIEFAKPQLSE